MHFQDALGLNTLEDIKCGYRYHGVKDTYECLFCGETYVNGYVYPLDSGFMDARMAARTHLVKEHGSPFEALLELEKKQTGLTELQRELLRRFYAGEGDGEIASALGTGSISTIRNQRFALRERAKQAKVFLAVMELFEERLKSEKEGVRTFPVKPRALKSLPHKDARKRAVVAAAAARFEAGRRYGKAETDQILKSVCEDYVELRRYLVDWGFLDREPDGSQYWVRGQEVSKEGKMDKKQLIFEYKNTPKPVGVFQIRNVANGKVLVGSSFNLTGRRNRFRMEVKSGNIGNNPRIRRDWEEYGADQFVFEVLEQVKPSEDPQYDYKADLAGLEQQWLDKLMPYGDRGYNPPPPKES